MMNRYLLASFLGGLTGAGCVLLVVYVTNSNALDIENSNIDTALSSLHARINDFYIFAGIVITLLLAINVGVYVKADHEVDKHFRENMELYEKKSKRYFKKSRKLTRKEKAISK